MERARQALRLRRAIEAEEVRCGLRPEASPAVQRLLDAIDERQAQRAALAVMQLRAAQAAAEPPTLAQRVREWRRRLGRWIAGDTE